MLADPQCIIRTTWHANSALEAPHRAIEALCGMMTWPRTRSYSQGTLNCQEVPTLSLGAELPGIYLPADAAEYGALVGLAAPQWAKQFEHLLV